MYPFCDAKNDIISTLQRVTSETNQKIQQVIDKELTELRDMGVISSWSYCGPMIEGFSVSVVSSRNEVATFAYAPGAQEV